MEKKFNNPLQTLDGSDRAFVEAKKLSDVNFAKEIIACNDHNSALLYLEKKINI